LVLNSTGKLIEFWIDLSVSQNIIITNRAGLAQRPLTYTGLPAY